MSEEQKKLYKILVGGKSCHGGSMQWSLPTQQKNGSYKAGKWMSVDGKVSVCKNGLHVTNQPMKWWKDTKDVEIYEVEVSGQEDHACDAKSAHEFVRLIRPIDDLEFERLFGVVLVRSPRKGEIILKEGQKAFVYDNAKVTASANAKVTAYANAQVTAYANAQVTASANAKVTASANAKVTATANAQVTATDNAKVTAYANAKVTATDNAQVTAYANAQVTASANAQVTAYANAKVTATDNAKVTAYDNAQVTATDNAKVTASANAQVTAYANAVVILPNRPFFRGKSSNVILQGDSVLVDQTTGKPVVRTASGLLVPATAG